MILLFVSVLVLSAELSFFGCLLMAQLQLPCFQLFIICKVFHFHYFVFQFAIVPCFMLVMIVKVLRSSGDNSQQICSLSKRAHSTLHPVRNFASFILSTRPLIVKVLKQEVKPLCPSDQRAAESQFKRGKTMVAVNMTKLQSVGIITITI